MAELQVGIKADVRDARRVVKSLKDIRKAAGDTSVSLRASGKAAQQSSIQYAAAATTTASLGTASQAATAGTVALGTSLSSAAAAAGRSATTNKAAATSTASLATASEAAAGANVSLTTSLKTVDTAAKGAAVSEGAAVAATSSLGAATDFTASANAFLATTLTATAASATRTATATGSLSAAQTAASGAADRLTGSELVAKDATDRLTAAMARLRAAGAGIFAGPTAGAKRFGTQARTAAGSVVGLSTAAAGIGATLAVGLGVGVKSAVEFEKTLSRIEGLVGLTAAEVEAFEQPLLDIGKATAKGPNELAEALFFVTSAGFEGQEALDVLEASAKAASAGLGETKIVADAVTSAVNAYGIENLNASKATDILVATVREGKAEADSIAGALGQVLPAASELGVEFEELGGTIAALTRIGLGADQGATALGATLAAIQKPGQQAKDTLEQYGTSASELRKKVDEEGLLAALQDLQERFGDNEEALTRVFPNIRALRAILPLVGKNAGDVADIFTEVADSAGSAQAAFDVYTKTSSFDLNQSLVVLQTTLLKLGDDVLPAITLAFVKFVEVIEGTVGALRSFSENVAAFFVGSDDPLERAKEQLNEVEDALRALERSGTSGAKLNDLFGIEVNDRIKLEGSLENQLKLLRDEESRLRLVIKQTNELNAAAERRKNLAEETAAAEEKGKDPEEPVVVIDTERQDAANKSLKELRDELTFLREEATNLQELGQEGIGLAEDFMITSKLARDLQGNIKEDAVEIRGLVNEKRELQKKINDITEAFQRQDAATQFLKDLREDATDLAEQFAMVQSGGSLVEVQALQTAQQIMADLGAETTETVEGIQAAILQQQAWNAALEAMDTSELLNVKTFIDVLKEQRAIAETAEDVERLDNAIKALSDSAIEDVAKKYGVSADDIDFKSIEEKLVEAEAELREAWSWGRVLDPDEDPEFEAVLQKIKDKITGVNDIMAEFGKAAAQNLQQNFSDFLFDPFADGLDGMAENFAKTLHRLASDILANMILMEFFKSMSNMGGGFGAFANAAIGALGGGGARAEGGPVSAGQSYLVGERGPEIITPRQSGSVIPNHMLGGQQEAPKVEVGGPTIVNTIEDSAIVAAFNRGGGGQVILNDMSEKRSAYRQALGINN